MEAIGRQSGAVQYEYELRQIYQEPVTREVVSNNVTPLRSGIF